MTKREGVYLIATERMRQIKKESWSETHDDEHEDGELALAAVCYALPTEVRHQRVFNKELYELLWPWDSCWWNPKSRKRDLVRAGALIAAELDKLLRAEQRHRNRKSKERL